MCIPEQPRRPPPRYCYSMQAIDAITSDDVGLRAITGRTSDSAAMHDDDRGRDERWRTWRARGATIDRERARAVGRGLAALFVALSAWLAFRLFS